MKINNTNNIQQRILIGQCLRGTYVHSIISILFLYRNWNYVTKLKE